ncbi:hypothetical protein [Glaciecola sp.]|uniref:hypothetical protein n=1 Tax=Glaciecola sp. MF2-115 TaxID=3384827 RepID=UPI0039898310
MEDIVGEIGKGFFRAIGYLLAEVFFWFICYWTGWPVCKIITLGKYPKPKRADQWGQEQNSGLWCCLLGLAVWIVIGLYLLGAFS